MIRDRDRVASPLTEESALSLVTEPSWWQTGVIYQVYPRSFRDTNDDGIGDLAGVTERLDYLKDTLGIDAVWLSPFYPSPMADLGYDVSNYVDVDPLFGTLEDFDRLVREAHRRGLRVIIDYVPNHTSDQHPWFVESRSSRSSPKRDWYLWADPSPDGSPPNNWLSVFGGPAWEWDEKTQQYYMHAFLREQPDLNWRNPDMVAAMFGVLRFWLDRGADGIRVDVAQGIMKDPERRDNPPNMDLGTPYKPLGTYDSQLHIRDRSHPDLHAIYRQMRQTLDSYPGDRVAIGEIHIFDYIEWASYFGKQLDEFQLPFNFGLIGIRWNAAAVRALIDTIEDALPRGAWPTYVLGNHDEHRIASRLGQKQARVAAMLLLTLRGTPTIYQGEEIGMVDVEISPEQSTDPWGKITPGFGLGRDPERTPMQWDGTDGAGFTGRGVRTWLPIGDNRQINVADQLNDPESTLSLYRSLLAVRRSHVCLTRGSYRALEPSNESVLVFERRAKDERAVVVLNFTGQAQQVSLDDPMVEVLLDTTGRGGRTLPGNALQLAPDAGLLLKPLDPKLA